MDYVIRGARVIDGTGGPGRAADIGIEGDRIVAVGTVDGCDAKVVDGDGLIAAPGFIDPHTHYDGQLCWDGYATPSSLHGVTSVIGGNCGFTLAPLRPEDAAYTMRMMARVEGMPLAALEQGVHWRWESFAEYLDGLEGTIGVNAGFLVGHCALRRYVMGPSSVEAEAGPGELEAMGQLLAEALAAGGLGLSTTRSSTHSDGDGNPVASRAASEKELLQLCRVVGEHPGTTLEAIVQGCLTEFSDDEVELLAGMSATADRPVNWNVLNVGAADRARAHRQLAPSRRAREIGGRVVALTMPVPAEMNMSLATFCALWLIPGWSDVMILPLAEKVTALRDPEVRRRLLAAAEGTAFTRFTDFGNYRIGDTIARENAAAEGRLVSDLADEAGLDPFAYVVQLAERDNFRTVLWPQPSADTDEDWAFRRELWDDPDVLFGGSDAGAHLDRMLGSPYPTRVLADALRGRGLLSVERAVQMITDVPARLFGLRGRGQIREGWQADLVLFDPATVDSGPARRVYDLPGDSLRLTATSTGIHRVLVNGVESIVDGKPTGSRSGTVLRSGRHTETVTTH